MIDYGLRNNIEEFGFYDPIFGLGKKWLVDFLELFNFNEISYVWIETRLDILNEKLIKKFQKKKFFLMYGLESYSEKILSIMNKASNPRNFLNKFEKIHKVHRKLELLYAINILCNHPGETKITMLETFNKLQALARDDKADIAFMNIRFYHHFPGTILYNNYPYFKNKYGTVVYFPEWWKDENQLMLGSYCVKPSSELSFPDSFKLYTESYKQLEHINLKKLKITKPMGLLLKAMRIKEQIENLEKRKIEALNFFNSNNICSKSIKI